MSKLGNALIATGLAIGWLGCGDEIHYHGSDAAKGDPGVAGPNGGKGDTGAMGAPGAPATTNDGCNNTNTMGCFRPVGTLQGVIYDAYDRRPIANAKVIINYNGMAQTAMTDGSGTYAFANLPATAAGGISHPTTAGATAAPWVGAYSIVLDLSTPGVADTDHHYRLYQERKAQVVFTDLGDGESGSGSDQNTDTRVDGLVANLDFPIRQTRAAASGKVYNAETRAPMANVGLVVAYALATDQETVGQVAANTMTDAMGGYMISGIEEGATYALKPIDTRYGFAAGAANGTTYSGTPFYAPENGVVLILADILLQDRAGRDAVPPYVVSTSPKDNEILLSGADLAQSITVTFSEAMDQSQNANLATHLYLGLETNFDITGINTGNRSFPCLNVGAGPLAVAAAPANGNWTATGSNINAATKCATLLEVFTINTWDPTGKILTVDPQINFNAGLAFAYRLDLINTHVRDLAGNSRTGCLPASSTSQNGDAFNIEDTTAGCAAAGVPAGNAPDSSVFTFQAGAQPLPVANAAQEPDTSDAIVPSSAPGSLPPVVRTPTAVRSTSATFIGRQALGFYTNTAIQPAPLGTTDDLFVSWDPSAGAVGYVIYYKDPFYPNYQPLQMISTQSPNRLGYATNLATINATLAAVYGAGPAGSNTTYLPIDINWLIGRTGLGVTATLGISAVNFDGIEGPITDVAIHDDTTPEVCRGGVGPTAGTNGNCLNIALGGGIIALGADWDYSTGVRSNTLSANGIVLNDNQNDLCLGGDSPLAAGGLAFPFANVGIGRMACIQAPTPNNFGALTAAGFGERIINIELSEPVAVTELTLAKVRFVPGSVTNAAFPGNPNGTGATADQAASITAVGPFFLNGTPSAFTKYVAVKFANAFSINSGDTVVIGDGTAAASVADLFGNLATPARSSHTGAPVGAPAAAATDAPGIRFIDNQSPYIRNVTVDPVADTVTVKFTKRIFQDPAGTGPAGVADIAVGAPNAGGNYERTLVNFVNNTAVAAVPYNTLLPPTYVAQSFFPAGTTFHQSTAGGTLIARATYAAVANGDTVTFAYGDISWLNHGGSVQLNGVRNADFFSAIADTVGAGSRAKNFVDRGFQAFFNIPVDTAAAPLGVGPYGPLTNGVGTLMMADTVPARLSLVSAHRALGTMLSASTLAPTTTGTKSNEWEVACNSGAAVTQGGSAAATPFYVDVIVTDTQNPAVASDATNPASLQNPANWAIVLKDFGACGAAAGQSPCTTAGAVIGIGWTNVVGGTNGAVPDQVTFANALTVGTNTVACNGNDGTVGGAGNYTNLAVVGNEAAVPATPSGGSVCRIRFGLTFPNTFANTTTATANGSGCTNVPNSRKIAVASVTMNAAVLDARGNATSTHNAWSFSLDRNATPGAANSGNPGWTRN